MPLHLWTADDTFAPSYASAVPHATDLGISHSCEIIKPGQTARRPAPIRRELYSHELVRPLRPLVCRLWPRIAPAPVCVDRRLPPVILDHGLDRPPPLRDALLPRRRWQARLEAAILLRQLSQCLDIRPHPRFQPGQ